MKRITAHFIACTLFIGVNAQNIATGEYWIDTDPGFGQANMITYPGSSDVSGQSENISLSGLNKGLHHMGIRTQDDNGVWSLTTCRTFILEHSADNNIVSLEYFWDSDPGFGNGISEQLGQGSNVPNYTLMANVIPTFGEHYLYTRTLDERGAWSHTNVDTVQVTPVGIDELEALGIRIYPNPFVEQVVIEPRNNEEFIVDLRDMNGRSILQRKITGTTTIEVQGAASSVYQVLIIFPSGRIYSTMLSKL